MAFSDSSHITHLLRSLSISPPTMECNEGKPLTFSNPPFPVFTTFLEFQSTIHLLELCSDELTQGVKPINGILLDTFSEFTLELYTSSTNHTAKLSDIKAAVRRFFYERLLLVAIHLKHTQANPQLHSFLEEQMPLLRSWADYDGDLDLTTFLHTINPCLVAAASLPPH